MTAIRSHQAPQPTRLRVRTAVKAGGLEDNHSEPNGLRVRTAVKAGGQEEQHSEAPALRAGAGARRR